MEQFPVNQTALPENPLSDEEQVLHALQHQLSQAAQELLDQVQDPSVAYDDFFMATTNFNALPPEDRGKDRYDHSRPLTENRDRSIIATHPKGFKYTVLLQKNGEILLFPLHT